ncbi:hypothetical protein A7981_10350 [Methylovorus sp. MM2]|uniref:hypothetical protein n=1 Tax=Methylovorus sp. MM2 TaxID=1848038 RepID=UPI0007E19C6D|nr:hypothetical protein [Methylovorus sp. MM2]OAM51918.1 hypothetical protein A7981_10350 [Methylovorus sp. MM2]
MSVPNNRQQGAALILMMFIITLATMAYVMKSFDADSMQASHEEKTYQVLAEAKEVLIGWAVSHPNVPGMMLYPDRLESTNPNYDGKSDCPAAANPFSYSYLIGQFPQRGQTNPCISPQTSMGLDLQDADGNRLWYAVSRNLVHEYQSPGRDPIINPGMQNVNLLLPSPYAGNTATSAYPWMKVYDINGNLLSNRVAVVLMAPGRPLSGQDRSSVTPPASAFLESTIVNGILVKNYEYSDEEKVSGKSFVIGGQKDEVLNDRLVYITIDELIAVLEVRAVNEAKVTLNNYFVSHGHFPYAAVTGGAGSGEKYVCVTGNTAGGLPVDVATVDYTIASGSFSSHSEACTFTSTTCSCTGKGSCSGAQTFTCDGWGTCSSTGAGSVKFIGGKFTAANGSCSLSVADACGVSTVSCLASGGIAFDGCAEVLSLPSWFTTNRWQDFIHYTTMARDGSHTLTSGAGAQARTGISALVVTTGPAITEVSFATAKNAAQVRPSCDLKDYLDTVENTDLNNVYEARSKQKTLNYNDRVFVVAP